MNRKVNFFMVTAFHAGANINLGNRPSIIPCVIMRIMARTKTEASFPIWPFKPYEEIRDSPRPNAIVLMSKVNGYHKSCICLCVNANSQPLLCFHCVWICDFIHCVRISISFYQLTICCVCFIPLATHTSLLISIAHKIQLCSAIKPKTLASLSFRPSSFQTHRGRSDQVVQCTASRLLDLYSIAFMIWVVRCLFIAYSIQLSI